MLTDVGGIPVVQTGGGGCGYGYGDGCGGGGLIWIIVLFALFAGGNGGGLFGGGNATNAANMGTISNDFMFTNLHQDMNYGFANVNNTLGELGEAVCAVDKDVLMTGCKIENKLAENDYHTQIGFMQTERNLDCVKYENAKNTCEILQNQNCQTQAILNKMDCIEMQNLRDKLDAARDELSNMRQSAYLVEQIRPCAKPSYITCSPYTSITPGTNVGYAGGFGYGGGYGRGFDGFGRDGFGHDGCGCGCC